MQYQFAALFFVLVWVDHTRMSLARVCQLSFERAGSQLAVCGSSNAHCTDANGGTFALARPGWPSRRRLQT